MEFLYRMSRKSTRYKKGRAAQYSNDAMCDTVYWAHVGQQLTGITAEKGVTIHFYYGNPPWSQKTFPDRPPFPPENFVRPEKTKQIFAVSASPDRRTHRFPGKLRRFPGPVKVFPASPGSSWLSLRRDLARHPLLSVVRTAHKHAHTHLIVYTCSII